MAAAIPFILAAGSAYVEDRSNKDVEDRQKRIAEAMAQFQTSKAREGQAAIGDFLEKSSPANMAAQSADIRQALGAGLEKSVDTVRGFERPDNFSGKVSDAYTTRVASNQAAVADRLKRAMAQLAIIGTPAEQGLQQQFQFGHTAANVDAANSAIKSTTPVFEGAISRVRPRSFDTFSSKALSGASNATSGRRTSTL